MQHEVFFEDQEAKTATHVQFVKLFRLLQGAGLLPLLHVVDKELMQIALTI